MHNQVKAGERARAEHTEMGVQLRKELYMVRDKLGGDIKTVADAVSTEVPKLLAQQIAAAMAKIEIIDGHVQILQQQSAGLSESNTKMTKYLEELHSERPREGAVVAEAFGQVKNEVNRVRDLVQQIEQKPGQVMAQNVFQGEILTKEMLATLCDMHQKILNLDQVYGSYDAMFARVEQTHVLTEALSTSCAEFTQRILTLEENIPLPAHGADYGAQPGTGTGTLRLNLRTAFSGTAAQAQGCGQGACGSSACGTNTTAPAWNPGSAPPSQGPPGMPGSSGGPADARIAAMLGGNGICHCIHVKELQDRTAALERRAAQHQGVPDLEGRADPWSTFRGVHGAEATCAAPSMAARRGPRSLPLTLKGPLGAIGYKDRGVFDEKLALQDEYRFDGVKGGLAWKGKTERYFIGRAPILKEILDWAEECDLDVISVEKLQMAVGGHLTEEQLLNVNAAIWGFLSGAVSGTAETIFKRADTLNGIDAWRRLVRYVDHGKEIRFETLRREVKMLHMKPISSLDKVEEGVAEWENTMNEYILAGGTPYQDSELKADLLAVLPAELRESLLWQSTKAEVSFASFRDHVITQSSKILMNRRKLPVHVVDNNDDSDSDEAFDFQNISSVEDMIAALQRLQRRNGGRFPPRGGARDGGRDQQRGGGAGRERDERAPRKCPNCASTHPGRCTKAPVAPADRVCFGCGEKGHVSSRCPKKTGTRSVKAVGEDTETALKAFFMVDEGFREVVGRGGKPRPPSRPMPTKPTLGDFVVNLTNKFEAMAEDATPVAAATSGDSLASLTAAGRPGYPRVARTGEVAYMKDRNDSPAAGRGSSPDIKVADTGLPAQPFRPRDVRRALQEAQNLIDDEVSCSDVNAVDSMEAGPEMRPPVVQNQATLQKFRACPVLDHLRNNALPKRCRRMEVGTYRLLQPSSDPCAHRLSS